MYGRCDYYRCCDRYGPDCTQSHYSDHTSLQVVAVAAVVVAVAVVVVVVVVVVAVPHPSGWGW